MPGLNLATRTKSEFITPRALSRGRGLSVPKYLVESELPEEISDETVHRLRRGEGRRKRTLRMLMSAALTEARLRRGPFKTGTPQVEKPAGP